MVMGCGFKSSILIKLQENSPQNYRNILIKL